MVTAPNDIEDRLTTDYEAKIAALGDVLVSRLEGMDKASTVLAENVNRVPTLLDRETARLQALFDEKLLGVDTISKETTNSTNALVNRLTVAVAESVMGARMEAQTANDALQRLLEAAMASSTKLADVRFDAQEVAIGKTETAIATALASSQTAIDAARNSAAAAVLAVEQKSAERMGSLQQLIELRARMNETAVEKANEATEKRFESVNEFRTTLSDQARNFVTGAILNARDGQINTQLAGVERQMRSEYSTFQTTIADLSMRIERREGAEMGRREDRTDGHMTIGSVVGIIGGAVAVLGFLLTVFLNMHQSSGIVSAVPFNPTVGADTKRVDDLIARFDALSNRMNNLPLPSQQPTPVPTR